MTIRATYELERVGSAAALAEEVASGLGTLVAEAGVVDLREAELGVPPRPA